MGQDKAPVFTVMFVDISGAGSDSEAQSEEQTNELFDRWIATLSILVADFEAMLVRSVGPTLRCSFERTDDAVRCAARMQQSVKANSRAPTLRAGVHVGEVILHGETYSGAGVKMAARMAMLAEPGQIVCTPIVFSAVSMALQPKFRSLGGVDLPGVQFGNDCSLYEISSNGVLPASPVTDMPSSNPQRSRTRTTVVPVNQDLRTKRKLVLRKAQLKKQTALGKIVKGIPAKKKPAKPVPAHPTVCRLHLVGRNGTAKVLEEDSTRLSIGRDSASDVVCSVDSASRNHAKIELRDGEFILIDHSRNGTIFYCDSDEEQSFVHNTERPLSPPSGCISPGRELLDQEAERLMYWIELE